MELLLTGERGFAFRDGGLGLADSGLGREQSGAAALGLLVELGGVELGEGLALFHWVIGVHQHFLGGAGKFAADDDLIGRRKIAGGGDDECDAAGFGIQCLIVRLILAIPVAFKKVPGTRAY